MNNIKIAAVLLICIVLLELTGPAMSARTKKPRKKKGGKGGKVTDRPNLPAGIQLNDQNIFSVLLAFINDVETLKGKVASLEPLKGKVASLESSFERSPIKKLGELPETYYMSSFNFKDQMALSMCTALSHTQGVEPGKFNNLILQVRRDCNKVGLPTSQTCEEMCKSVRAINLIGQATCFDALLIYSRSVEPYRQMNPDIDGPYINDSSMYHRAFHYTKDPGCRWKANHCGPNYCCCRGQSS